MHGSFVHPNIILDKLPHRSTGSPQFQVLVVCDQRVLLTHFVFNEFIFLISFSFGEGPGRTAILSITMVRMLTELSMG